MASKRFGNENGREVKVTRTTKMRTTTSRLGLFSIVYIHCQFVFVFFFLLFSSFFLFTLAIRPLVLSMGFWLLGERSRTHIRKRTRVRDHTINPMEFVMIDDRFEGYYVHGAFSLV